MSQGGAASASSGGGGGGGVSTLTGNSGGAVAPTGGNINTVGDGTTINAVGNPGTSTITLSATGVFTDLTAEGTVKINDTGTGTTTIGGASGAVTINAGAGNLAIKANGHGISIANDGTAGNLILGSGNASAQTQVKGGGLSNILLNSTGLNLNGGLPGVQFGSWLFLPTLLTSSGSVALGFANCVVSVDTTANSVTLTLPTISASKSNFFVIKDSGGNAAVNNITVDGNGTNIIAAGAVAGTFVISANYAGIILYSDGSSWLGFYTL